MWQPNRRQWSIIWTVAVVLVLCWPPAEGRSLAVKAVNWAADPGDALPTLPAQLPIGLDDNGDAVAAHDLQATEYYRLYDRSPMMRWRLKAKMTGDPFDPQTERQLLVGLAVAAALSVWRLNQG